MQVDSQIFLSENYRYYRRLVICIYKAVPLISLYKNLASDLKTDCDKMRN